MRHDSGPAGQAQVIQVTLDKYSHVDLDMQAAAAARVAALVTGGSTVSEARPSTGGAEFYDILRDFAVADYAFDAAKRAGLLSPAEAKAYEARRAHLIERIDEARGTKPVSYAMFRAALDQGADCEVLYGLRNRMDPNDPLKEDANSDLRSVGCHTSKATRGDRS